MKLFAKGTMYEPHHKKTYFSTCKQRHSQIKAQIAQWYFISLPDSFVDFM